MSSFTQPPWPTWAYTNEVSNGGFTTGYTQYPHYSSYLSDSMDAYQAHHHHLVHHHQMSRTTESKPRLSKEEVETLEAEFQKNHKPNSSTKKALAESMRVDNARINNWFQNRRAREKKERNIREYEARQKLEKQKNAVEDDMTEAPDRKSKLVASSAPFPNAQRPPQRLSSSSRAIRDSPLSDEGGPQTQMSSNASNAGSFAAHGSCTSPSNAPSESNDAEFALSTDDEDTDYYGKPLSHVVTGGDFRNPPSIFTAYSTDNLAGFPPMAQSSPEHDLSLRSPASFDIAARRNRRPPPLAIDGRSCSTGAPGAGLDMMRKGDTMRRVASATGSMRISKSMGAPRSPYMLSRSPVPAGLRGSHAPPTPDTPVLANQPGINTLDRGAGVSELAIRDPNLRTPPTTPGVSQTFFSLNSIYDMTMTESGLPTLSLGRYNGGLDHSGVSVGATHYVTNSGVSQPQTPSFVSPISHFGMDAGQGPEYTWP
ncbi:putative homeobox transcription factor [Emericellopsis atlantica]|uniref:Homeobox transcription factor n=1 Tax=Emericellopsis atlantica TaxID=2614577 RepID=A0A9P7ZD42_9HYPO|nr:putative homeobox transcription factor [Emericellopsis atlantica]KAG9249889.1 putative homeobox transcription factor [Emericellopsis atlantica]